MLKIYCTCSKNVKFLFQSDKLKFKLFGTDCVCVFIYNMYARLVKALPTELNLQLVRQANYSVINVFSPTITWLSAERKGYIVPNHVNLHVHVHFFR